MTEFRIGIGGPFWRLEQRAHIEPLKRLVPLALAAGWAPLLVLTFLEWALGRAPEPLVRDLSVHARFVVALPLLLAADRLLNRTARTVMMRLHDEGYLPAAEEARVKKLLAGVIRLRDSTVPELLLLGAALASGVAALVGLLPPAGTIHGLTSAPSGPVRIWYGLVSLPLFQFFLWRSLFRWALWVRVLVGLSRVRLRLLPGHADRNAGIGFIKQPTVMYCSLLLFATSSILCAGWGTQALYYGARIDTLKPLFFAYVLIGIVIAFAPLLGFVPQLFLARMAARRTYGNLVSDYTRRFEEKWLAGGDRSNLLGTQDIQAFADLGGSYRDGVRQMQIFLFTPRDCVVLLAAAMLPALPLMFLQSPAHEVLQRLLKLLVGRLPV
jgi:hypothetical protein